MGLFDLLFGAGNTDDWYGADDPNRSQASADYQGMAGGWREPDPPNTWRDFDHRQDGGWW